MDIQVTEQAKLEILRHQRQEIDRLKAELAKLQEWERIILGTGGDQEAIIRMAASQYIDTSIDCWKAEVAKLKAELEQSQHREARLRGLLERARVALSIDAAALTILQEDIYEALTETQELS